MEIPLASAVAAESKALQKLGVSFSEIWELVSDSFGRMNVVMLLVYGLQT